MASKDIVLPQANPREPLLHPCDVIQRNAVQSDNTRRLHHIRSTQGWGAAADTALTEATLLSSRRLGAMPSNFVLYHHYRGTASELTPMDLYGLPEDDPNVQPSSSALAEKAVYGYELTMKNLGIRRMHAVKYLVKLYEMPEENGEISAFDTHANTIFTGTTKGILFKFRVDGAQGSDASVLEVHGTYDNGIKKTTKNMSSTSGQPLHAENRSLESTVSQNSERIYTTIVRQVSLSDAQGKIERIQHSRTHNLLFVLYEHHLVVLDSINLSHIQTIAECVGTFYVSDLQKSHSKRSGLHVICTSELNGRGLSVYEFNASQGKHAWAVLTQELVLPEPAQALVTYGSIACIGMRREYSLISLSDGSSSGVLTLGGGRQPLLAAGDGEVFMRYNQSIFSVSMRSFPSGRVLGRTIQLEDEALSFAVRHPFLFAFTERYCDVCSLYDDNVSARLPLPGCLFSSQLGRGDFLYAANKTKIWMARLHSLRHQLADLVERFKVEEAFQLLGSQRNSSTLDLQGIELELHVMAGFAYLHHCRPKEAMLHFNDHIDPRDLLLLLPECIPPLPDAYSVELKSLLATKALRRHANESANVTSTLPKVESTGILPLRERKGSHPGIEESVVNNTNKGDEKKREDYKEEQYNNIAHNDDDNDNNGGDDDDDDEDEGFWANWGECCPYNTYTGELQQAWLETFETFPVIPEDSNEQTQGERRQVTEWGAVTAATFLERSWELFKDELIVYFRSRLRHTSDVYARAMEYALLILAIEAQDHRAAYRIVTYGSSLRVEDCYDILSALREYCLLACLLYHRGWIEEANNVLSSRVYVSSFLPQFSSYACVAGEPAPIYKTLPKTMHAKLDKLLSHSLEPTHTTAAESLKPVDVESVGAVTEMSAVVVNPVDASEAGGSLTTMTSPVLPGSLSEEMYLVTKLNLPALRELLRETPMARRTVDEEGCSLLHVLFSSLVLMEEFLEDDTRSESGGALLNLIVSCAILLLDCGVDVSVLNSRGLSCLDIVALAADGVFADIVVSALLANRDVRDIAAAVEKSEAVVALRAV